MKPKFKWKIHESEHGQPTAYFANGKGPDLGWRLRVFVDPKDHSGGKFWRLEIKHNTWSKAWHSKPKEIYSTSKKARSKVEEYWKRVKEKGGEE